MTNDIQKFDNETTPFSSGDQLDFHQASEHVLPIDDLERIKRLTKEALTGAQTNPMTTGRSADTNKVDISAIENYANNPENAITLVGQASVNLARVRADELVNQ